MIGFLIAGIESYGFSIPVDCDFKPSKSCTTQEPRFKTPSYQWFQRDVSVFTRISDRGQVEAQHAIGVHQNKLRETLKQWKAVLQSEYGEQGEVKISSLAVKHCPICQQAESDSDVE